MTSRRAPLLVGALLFVVLAVLIWLWTPWHPLAGAVPGGHVAPDARRDFTAAQIARETSFHNEIRPWGLLGLALSLVVPALFGFTRLGASVTGRIRRRAWRLPAAVLLVTGATFVVLLPIAARGQVIERRFRLSREGWSLWLSLAGRGYLVTFVSSLLAVLVVVWLAHRFPRRWWAAAGATAALLVVGGSYVYPFVVEPIFTKTTSLPAGPLRNELLALAARDGQPLHDILVAHEASRTASENAYVSGFGSSRRLVLYDTLLHDDTPGEVAAVTAHELGHSKHHDVLHGTIEGAVGVAAAICLLAGLVTPGGRVLRRVGASSAGDPRVAPLLLATYAVTMFVVSPGVNLLSRHVEASADAHSLSLDRNPAAFVASQRKLAISNLDDLQPSGLLYVLFFNHPTTPQRIAMARDWARQHHRPEPTALRSAGQVTFTVRRVLGPPRAVAVADALIG